MWSVPAGRPSNEPCQTRSAKQLAFEFLRALQTQPALIGLSVTRLWVQSGYSLFTRYLGETSAPHYKFFAKELARLMERKRIEIRQGGRRVDTVTVYKVPHPAAGVVALADAQRKRA
jgi:hypothetical protein